MSQIKDFPERTNPKFDDFLYLITQGNTDFKILINTILGRGLTKEEVNPTYTLVATDIYHKIRFTFPGNKVVTVPEDASVSYAANSLITIRNANTGTLTLLPETGGVIINTKGGLVIPAHGEVNLVNVAPDLWDASGDLLA